MDGSQLQENVVPPNEINLSMKNDEAQRSITKNKRSVTGLRDLGQNAVNAMQSPTVVSDVSKKALSPEPHSPTEVDSDLTSSGVTAKNSATPFGAKVDNITEQLANLELENIENSIQLPCDDDQIVGDEDIVSNLQSQFNGVDTISKTNGDKGADVAPVISSTTRKSRKPGLRTAAWPTGNGRVVRKNRSVNIKRLQKPTAAFTSKKNHRQSHEGAGLFKKTPSRWHSKPKHKNYGTPQKHYELKLTAALTPRLHTASLHHRHEADYGSETPEEPLAQRIAKFARTPERWHSQAPGAGPPPAAPASNEFHLTEPISPQLHTATLRGRSNSNCSFLQEHDIQPDEPTLAERVAKFESTPERWHSESAKAGQGPLPPRPKFQPKITVPTEPRLSESRPREAIMSTEEREVAFIQSLKPFKARVLDQRVMNSAGQLGVPKVEKKQLTQAKSFTFRSDQRLANRRGREPASTSTTAPSESKKPPRRCSSVSGTVSSSRARGAGTKPRTRRSPSANAPVSRPQRTRTGPTVPRSPMLLTKQRGAAKPAPRPVVQEVVAPFKALAMPTGAPFAVQPTSRPPTSTKPFALSTEKRGELHQHAFHEQLEKQEDEEAAARQFHARDLPPSIDAPPPATSVAEGMAPGAVTEPVPFRLMSVDRSIEAKMDFEAKLQEEEEAAAEARAFVAHDLPDTHISPFKVQCSSRPVTSPREFQLHSTSRAEAREEYETALEERREETREAQDEAERERKEEEEEELRELRRNLTFKATPVMHAEPLVIQHSQKQLTVPKTPATFHRRRGGEGAVDESIAVESEVDFGDDTY